MVYSTALQKGTTLSMESSLALRINFFFVNTLAFVAFSYYCSDLTAKMTHMQPGAQLKNLEVVLHKNRNI